VDAKKISNPMLSCLYDSRQRMGVGNSMATDLRKLAYGVEFVVKVLLGHGYRVLQYDQPGHGGSSVPSDLNLTTFESMADDVASLLKGLDIDKLNAWIGIAKSGRRG